VVLGDSDDDREVAAAEAERGTSIVVWVEGVVLQREAKDGAFGTPLVARLVIIGNCLSTHREALRAMEMTTMSIDV